MRRLLVTALVMMMCGGCASRAAGPSTAPPTPPLVTVPATTDRSEPPASEPPDAPAEPPPVPVIQPFEHIKVHLTDRIVEVEAVVCLNTGWLEQIVCIPGTREHEALMVTQALPSHIHASLLLIGLEPGIPGRWSYENDEVSVTPPSGATLDVWVRHLDSGGEPVEHSVRRWIRDHLGQAEFPDDPWVFAGSFFADQPEQLGGGQVYVADISGSVVGLVTFGDEVVGFANVLADQEAVAAPQWEANTDTLPPIGTAVTLVFKPFDDGSAD